MRAIGSMAIHIADRRVVRPLVLLSTVLAALTIACTSTSVTAPGGSVTKCQVSLTAPEPTAPAGGGTATLSVSAAPECAWTASTNSPWISELVPASGQGAATVQMKFAANASPAIRQGDVVVNGVTVHLSQEAAPCVFNVSTHAVTLPTDGGSSSISVTAVTGCSWTAASQAGWLTITAGQSGDGNGSVAFNAAAHSDPLNPRSGTLVIAGATVAITQPPRGCTVSLSPPGQTLTAAAASGTVTITSAATCGWTATADVPWIAVTGGSPGSGSGVVAFSAAANAGAARTGRVVVGGEIFTITQAAAAAPTCAFTIAPAGQSFTNSGGAGAVAVTGPAGCAWSAVSNAPWITVTSGASGSGSGSSGFSVAANTGAARSGTLLVAGQNFSVNQSAAASPTCTYNVSPLTQSIGAGGGPASPISVTTGGSCAWSVSTTTPWVHLSSSVNVTGPASVAFTVDSNTGGQRSGSAVVAGQTVTINQAAGATTPACSFSVTPQTHSVPVTGGSASASVTTTAGCAWTAASNDPWITINTGNSGNDSGSVGFSVSANVGGARSGTLTVAGTSVVVNQPALLCNYSIAPGGQSVGAAAGAGVQIAVTTSLPLLCSWTANALNSWLHITGPSGGSGNGTVNWTYDVNTGPSRTGSIAISGQTFSVTQAGACSYSLNKTSDSQKKKGMKDNVKVIAAAGCAWTASSNAGWITITSGASGNGNGTVAYDVADNNTGANRTGTITVAGLTFTITQDH